MQILEQAYARIRDDQVRELSSEMNGLFAKMAANVVDDEEVEDDQRKATLRMIAKIGLRALEDAPGEYEIFALNSRDRSMPPTEINGASRRILALSFVLGLCKASRTLAPLIADSLLNFMSGSVRTNTLRITAETASQPILLLTGSDLESQNEVDLVARYGGSDLYADRTVAAHGARRRRREPDGRAAGIADLPVRTARSSATYANARSKPKTPDGRDVNMERAGSERLCRPL